MPFFFFLVLAMTRPGIEPRSPGPLANTLPNEPNFIFALELLSVRFNNYFLTLAILYNIYNLFALNEVVTSIAI